MSGHQGSARRPGTGTQRAGRKQGRPGQEWKERLLLHLILFKAVRTYWKLPSQCQLLSSPRSRSPWRIASGAVARCCPPRALTLARGKPPLSPGTGGGTAWPGSGRGLRSFPSPSVETRRRSRRCYSLIRTGSRRSHAPLASGAPHAWPPLAPTPAGLAPSTPLLQGGN